VEDERSPICETQLEANANQDHEAVPGEGRTPDPELDAWLAMREVELEEQRFALAEREGRWW
jgi:hypothetical protein